MAFSSSNNDDDSVLSEINITPLVDVMLVLLVAFIVTAPLLNNAIKVNLPKTESTKQAEPSKPVTIVVNKEGAVFVGYEPVEMKQLEARLKELQQANPAQVYHLSSDEEVQYGAVAKVMAAIERAGITKIAVLTQAE